MSIRDRTYADIARSISVLAVVLDLQQQGLRLNDEIRINVDRIAQTASNRHAESQPSVYFEVDSTPFAAGESSFIGELLNRLGTRNIVPGSMGPFPKLNPEYVVTHDPDVILELGPNVVAFEKRPGWSAIRAVREHRICTFTDSVKDTLSRPGPRVAEGVQAMADCLARVSP